MKKIFVFTTLVATTLFSCDVLNEAAGTILTPTGTTAPSLTNAEVISGLKEALTVGIKNSVNLTSVTDGFLGNAAIRLPFPPDAIKVKEKALEWGLQGQVDKFETTLNRAAEEATKEALPIFLNAITNMSVADGFAILNGGQGAATKFLQDNTTAALMAAFKPKVAAAIATVKLTDYWNPLASKYNTAMTLTGGQKVTTDLSAFVTDRAISGLFTMVTAEENKIRQDPMARVSDILVKVFGSIQP
ncbi:MAG: DUF4197 domain-containing protein [Crocinitomicaceae bacterium]